MIAKGVVKSRDTGVFCCVFFLVFFFLVFFFFFGGGVMCSGHVFGSCFFVFKMN